MAKLENVSGSTKYDLYQLLNWFAGDVQPTITSRKMFWLDFIKGILLKWDMQFDRNIYEHLILEYLYNERDLRNYIEFIEGHDKIYEPDAKYSASMQSFFNNVDKHRSIISNHIDKLRTRLLRIIPDIEYTRPEFVELLAALGYILYWDHPDDSTVKGFKKYQDKLSDFNNRQLQIQRALNLIKAVAMIFVSSDIKDPKKHEQEVSKSEEAAQVGSALIDEAVEAAGEVTIQTITNEFNDGRKIIKDELNALDEQIPFDLSGVISEIDRNNRKSIEDMEDILLENNRSIIESIVANRQAIDTALTEPQSKERQAMEELNMTTGVGFVYALDKFLHKKKVG